MLPNFRIALPATLALSIFASACSTPRPAPQFPPNAPQGQDTREIGLIARPIALLFVSMDRDGDSVTTAEEFTDGMDKEWDSQFRNTDTHLTPFEYEEWAKKKLGHSKAMPSRISFDTDLDGLFPPCHANKIGVVWGLGQVKMALVVEVAPVEDSLPDANHI